MARVLDKSPELTEAQRYAISGGRLGSIGAEEKEVYEAICDFRDLHGLYSFMEIMEIRKEGGERLRILNQAKELSIFLIDKPSGHNHYIEIKTPDVQKFVSREYIVNCINNQPKI